MSGLRISDEQLKKLIESLEPDTETLNKWLDKSGESEEPEFFSVETESRAKQVESEEDSEEETQNEGSAIDDLVSQENFHEQEEVSESSQPDPLSYVKWQDTFQLDRMEDIKYFEKLQDYEIEVIRIRYMQELKEQLYNHYQ